MVSFSNLRKGSARLTRISHKLEATTVDSRASLRGVGLSCPQHGTVEPASKNRPPYPNLPALPHFRRQTREKSALGMLWVFFVVFGELLCFGGALAADDQNNSMETAEERRVSDPCLQSSLGETTFCSVTLKPLYVHELSSPDLFARVAAALELARVDNGLPTVADVATVQQLVYGIFCAEELMRRGQGGLWVASDLAEMWSLLTSSAEFAPDWVKNINPTRPPALSAREQRDLDALVELLEQLPKLTLVQFPIARDRVLTKVPNHPQTLRAAARADMAARRYPEALAWLKQYEAREPDNPYSAMLYLSILAEVGGTEAVVNDAAQKVVQLVPAWMWRVHRLKKIAELRRQQQKQNDIDGKAISTASELNTIRDMISVGWVAEASASLQRLEQKHPEDSSVAVAAAGMWVTLNNQQNWENSTARALSFAQLQDAGVTAVWPARLLGAIRFRVLTDESQVSLDTLPEFQVAQKVDPKTARRVQFMVTAIRLLRHKESTDKKKVISVCLDTIKDAPGDPVVIRTAALLMWLVGEKEKAWNLLMDASSDPTKEERNHLKILAAMLGTALSAQTGDIRYVNSVRTTLAQLPTTGSEPDPPCPDGGCLDGSLVTYAVFAADLVFAILKDDLDLQLKLADRVEALSTTLKLFFEEAPRLVASLWSVNTFVGITQGRDRAAGTSASKARFLAPYDFPVVYNLALLALGAGDEVTANGFFDQAANVAKSERERHLVARLGLKFAEARRSTRELKTHLESLLTLWDSAVPVDEGRAAVELVVSGDVTMELALEHTSSGDRLVINPALMQTISVVRTMRGLTRSYVQDLLDQMNDDSK